MDVFNDKPPEATVEQKSFTGEDNINSVSITLEKRNADLPKVNTPLTLKEKSGDTQSASIPSSSPSLIWTCASVFEHAQSEETKRPNTILANSFAPSSPTTRCSAPSLPLSDPTVPSPPISKSSTLPSTEPPWSTTPVSDAIIDNQNSSRRTFGGQTSDGLWPSIRNLSSSFQAEHFIHASKDRSVRRTILDHTLKNLSKAVSERKITPLTGRNASEQSEYPSLVQGAHSSVVDQHRWPAMKGGKGITMALCQFPGSSGLKRPKNCCRELQDYVTMEKHKIEIFKQEMKLEMLLKEQVSYLEDWISIEGEYSTSLFRTIEALKASTLRLPVNGGARVDVLAVKRAFSSAIDIMLAMGSSVCFLLSKVEGTKRFFCQLSAVVTKEKEMLDECRVLLATVAAMKVEECSLRAQILQQLRQDLHM